MYGQQALSSGLLSNNLEHLSFDRILKRLEVRSKALQKSITDERLLKKLYLGYTLVDWARYPQLQPKQVPHLADMMEDLREKFEGPTPEGASRGSSMEGKSDSQKRFNRIVR